MSDSETPKPTIHIGGSVSGQNVVIGSSQTIHGDLSITVGNMQAVPENTREALKAEIALLMAELAEQPVEKQVDVQAVKLAVEDVISEMEKPKLEKHRLVIRGENLKKAADNLFAVAPTVAKIATIILSMVA